MKSRREIDDEVKSHLETVENHREGTDEAYYTSLGWVEALRWATEK